MKISQVIDIKDGGGTGCFSAKPLRWIAIEYIFTNLMIRVGDVAAPSSLCHRHRPAGSNYAAPTDSVRK